MTLASLIALSLSISIMAIVFSLGLGTRPADLIFLARRPWLLLRSLTAMNLIMPLFAIGAIELLHPGVPTSAALIALSLSPVPPILPRKQEKAGGNAPYAVGLLFSAALFAIVWIPLAIEGVERVFGVPLSVAPMSVALIVGRTILAPLLAGVLIGYLAKSFSERIAPILARAGTLVLLIGFVLIVVRFWHGAIALIGNGTVLALAGFVLFGLLVGHLLGGPDQRDRTVLAIAVASRHPGLALAIAQVNVPKQPAVPAVIVLYLVLSILVSIPYVRWRKRLPAASGAPSLSVR